MPLHLSHMQGERAGKIGEIPHDGGAFIERAAGAAGGEIAAQFLRIVDGIEHLGDRLGDLPIYLKLEIHMTLVIDEEIICYKITTCRSRIRRMRSSKRWATAGAGRCSIYS